MTSPDQDLSSKLSFHRQTQQWGVYHPHLDIFAPLDPRSPLLRGAEAGSFPVDYDFPIRQVHYDAAVTLNMDHNDAFEAMANGLSDLSHDTELAEAYALGYRQCLRVYGDTLQAKRRERNVQRGRN